MASGRPPPKHTRAARPKALFSFSAWVWNRSGRYRGRLRGHDLVGGTRGEANLVADRSPSVNALRNGGRIVTDGFSANCR